jgi:hypothetical protein
MERNVYPSPLNYYNFPKSVCTSVNEVIWYVRHSRWFELLKLHSHGYTLLMMPLPYAATAYQTIAKCNRATL